MKTIIRLSVLFVATVAIVSLSSCREKQTPPPPAQTVETTIIETTPGSGGVIFAKEITVARGETVWGYSQEVYGSGLSWRDIVSQNKFLQEPGRVYFDTNRKKWIAKIYPGEVVRIGGQLISPTYIFQTITTTPLSQPEKQKGFPLWLAILLSVLAVGSLIIIAWIRSTERNVSGGAGGNATINVRCGQSLEQATQCGIEIARHNRVCQMSETVASQMLGRHDLTGAHTSTVFTPDGAMEFRLSADYERQQSASRTDPSHQ